MERLQPLEPDYYLTEEWASDHEERNSDSSYDEVQEMMLDIAGVEPGHRRGVSCDLTGGPSFVSVDHPPVSKQDSKRKTTLRKDKTAKLDEFEMDMNDSLEEAMCKQASSWLDSKSSRFLTQPKQQKTDVAMPEETEVDPSLGLTDKGTDSDDECFDKETSSKSDVGTSEKKVDPPQFYDPDEDADNQSWIDQHRRTTTTTGIGENKTSKTQRLPNSDAVLNCPACMTLLCLDCQRHSVYKTQYRAMFVQNCTVNKEDTLLLPPQSQKKRNKKRSKTTDDDSTSGSEQQRYRRTEEGQPLPDGCKPEDLFHPVLCSICQTEIGVFDNDEIYHFFNVLSSYT